MKKKLYKIEHEDLNDRYRYIIVATSPVEAIKKFIEAANSELSYGDRFEEEGVTKVEELFVDDNMITEVVD